MTTPSFAERQAFADADKARKEVATEVTTIRRELEAQGLKPKDIQNNPRLLAAQAKLEEAKSAAGLLTTAQSLEILNRKGVGPKAADTRLASAQTKARDAAREAAYAAGRETPGYAEEMYWNQTVRNADPNVVPTVTPPPGYRWRFIRATGPQSMNRWELEASKEARERDNVGVLGGFRPWEFDPNTNSFVFVPNQFTPAETVGRFQPPARGGVATPAGTTMRLPTTASVIDGGGSVGSFPISGNAVDTGEYTYDDEFDRELAGGFTQNNTNTANVYAQFLKDQANLQTVEQRQSARAMLSALLRQFFFAEDADFINQALAAAEPDIVLGLQPETILLRMENYDDPNSLFSRRFTGNVKLRKEGIEPLSPAEYLQQESRYREVLSTRGLGELASRSTFGDLIGNQVSPFELEDRVTKVFDVYDSADAGLKTELQSTLKLDPLTTRTSVAKALLLGDKGATELQRQVRTAEVGVEARARGLQTTSAEELARMGVTREQARAGFEQIALTQPRLTQLSEMYTGATPDAAGLQQELEREQFQGMQSQRRRRLAEQETAAFMGQSGTAGSQSLARRRAGSI